MKDKILIPQLRDTIKDQDKYCELWPSFARIFATFIIYLFHFNVIAYDIKIHIDFLAISVFCFLTGYLVRYSNQNVFKWFLQRYLAIVVPFWIVMVFVLSANCIFSYKDISISGNVIVLLGGGFFVKERLYVISWYITLVLCQYLYICLFYFHPNWIYRLVIFLIFYFFFYKILMMPMYLIFCILGLVFGNIRNKIDRTQKNEGKFCKTMFVLQKYCYCYFLLHGAILLFFNKVFSVGGISLFAIALISSAILAIFLKLLSDNVLALIWDRIAMFNSSERTS